MTTTAERLLVDLEGQRDRELRRVRTPAVEHGRNVTVLSVIVAVELVWLGLLAYGVWALLL